MSQKNINALKRTIRRTCKKTENENIEEFRTYLRKMKWHKRGYFLIKCFFNNKQKKSK